MHVVLGVLSTYGKKIEGIIPLWFVRMNVECVQACSDLLGKPGEARKKHTRISLFSDRNVGRLQVVEVICTITQLVQFLSEGYLIFKEGKTKFNAPNNIRNIDWLPLVPLVKMINPSPKMIMSYHSASFLGDTLCNTHQNRLSSFWCFWSFWRLRWKMNDCIVDPQTETIESGPLCITDLFQNKYVAYCLFITTFL